MTHLHKPSSMIWDRFIFGWARSQPIKLYIAFLHWLIPCSVIDTVYPKKYAHGFCFAVLCCGYTLTDFPISIRLTSLALWQSNDCRSASKATLMNMDEYFMWIHYERLHYHNKAKHNKTVCIFLGISCTSVTVMVNFIFVVVNVRQHMLWAHRGSNVLVSWTSLEIRGVKG